MSSDVSIHEASRFFSAFFKAGGSRRTIMELTRDKTLMARLVETSQDPPSKHSIEVLNLGVRARKTMARLYITTIAELVQKSAHDILQVKNTGETTLREIRQKLQEHGRRLRGD